MRQSRVLQIVNNTRLRHIQQAAGGVDAVAFFGNGQRDNRHLRVTKFLNNSGERIEFSVQTFMHGADNNWLAALCAFFQHGKQVVLLAKLAHQPIAAEQANLTNPPVSAAGVKHPIGE